MRDNIKFSLTRLAFHGNIPHISIIMKLETVCWLWCMVMKYMESTDKIKALLLTAIVQIMLNFLSHLLHHRES